MKRFLRPHWLVLYSLAFLGGAAWYVPKLSAERYREPIRQGLENALGRKVEFSTLQFRLLPLPGFTITHLRIGEDPSIGPEPTAYIEILHGRPRLGALFGGPLEFASVDLEEASVNLTRAEGDSANVRWNFSSLTSAPPKASFPVVHMIGGRVNFKLGETKTTFYLLNTDADLWPPESPGDPWALKVRAEPARTDRPSHGFGSFVARGEWRPSDGAITVDVKLEKSELSDLATLFQGTESGLHGHVWGDAHFAGPANRVGLAGRLNIDDIHGWNQSPTPNSKAVPIILSGAVDARNQVLDLRAISAVPQLPFDLRYRAQDFLRRPRWALTALFDNTPLAPLVDVARHLGAALPEEMAVEGTVRGVLGYSLAADVSRLDGGLSLTGVTATPRGSTALKLGDANLTVSGAKASLAGAEITAANSEKAVLDAALDTSSGAFEWGLRTDGMALDTLRPFLNNARIPLLSQLSGGKWSGSVQSLGGPTNWSGELNIQDAALKFDGLSEPVQITQAEAELGPSETFVRRMNVTVGGLEAQGDYRYEYGATVPHTVHLTAASVDGKTIEKLFSPVLSRASLLNKTFRLGKVPTPEWLHDLRVGGTLQIARLALGPLVVNRLRARLDWDGETVTLPIQAAQAGAAAISGVLSADLTGAQPKYEFAGKVAGIPWKGGVLETEGSVSTNGTGSELLGRLTAKGAFTARNVNLSPLNQFSSAQGEFDLTWPDGDPRLSLLPLTATAAGTSWSGSVEPRDNGEIFLKLTSGDKLLQASGAVFRGESLTPAPAAR